MKLKKMGVLALVLLSVSPFASNKAHAASDDLIDQSALLAQFKANILTGVASLKREAEKATENSFFRDTTPGLIALSFVAPFLGLVDERTAESIFESGILDQLFNDSAISQHTQSAVTYRLSANTCQVVGAFGGSPDSELIDKCTKFLTSHNMSLKLAKSAHDEINLSLLYASSVETIGKTVSSLTTSPTKLGVQASLDGYSAFDSDWNTQVKGRGEKVSSFQSLEGLLELAAQFENDGKASGCDDNGSVCFMFNIVEPLRLDQNENDSVFKIHADASPSASPTVRLSGNGDSAFALAFNVANLDVVFGSANEVAYLPALKGLIKVLKSSEAGQAEVEVSDFSLGKESTVFGKLSTLAIDLNRDAGSVLKNFNIKWDEAAGVTVASSAASLQVKSVNSEDKDCIVKENLQVKLTPTSADLATVTLKNADSPRVSRQDEPCASASVLRDFVSFSKVECGASTIIQILEGILDVSYSRDLNGVTEAKHTGASKGECLGVASPDKDPENRDEL